MSRLFASGGQSTEASASASVLPMNIQGWFPLGLTGVISLQSKGLSRVFSSTTVQKNQFFSIQPSLWFNSLIHTWLLEKPQLWLSGPLLAKWSLLFGKVMSSYSGCPKGRSNQTHSFCPSTLFPPDSPAQGIALSFTQFPKPAALNAFKVLFPSVPMWHQNTDEPPANHLLIPITFLSPQLSQSFHNPRTPNSMKESESEVAKSYPTLCDPMDCSLPGSTVYGIFQARILEWVAISFSRRSSQTRDWSWVSHIVGRRYTVWATREIPISKYFTPL